MVHRSVQEGLADNKTQFCEPGDAGVTVTAAAGADTYGNAQTAIASTSQDQWLVGFSGELDAADIYTIAVYDDGALMAEWKYEAEVADTAVILSCLPIKAANGSAITMKCKTVGGGSQTISNADLLWRKA